MDSSFKIGDRVYIVANGINVQSFEITRIIDGFYTLRGIDNYSFIRLRKHRLFRSFEEAMIALNNMRKKNFIECRDTYRSPHYL